jgi:hypothetical protein
LWVLGVGQSLRRQHLVFFEKSPAMTKRRRCVSSAQTYIGKLDQRDILQQACFALEQITGL